MVRGDRGAHRSRIGEMRARLDTPAFADVTELDETLPTGLQTYRPNPDRLGQVTGHPWLFAGTEVILISAKRNRRRR